MPSFTIEKTTSAPPQACFDVITDHRAYPDFSSVRKVELEREGEPPPNGLGAVRVMTAVGPKIREEVVAYEPPSKFAYTVLSGLPVRDHVGTVTIAPEGEGSRVTYAMETTPTIRLISPVIVAIIKQAVSSLLKGAIKEAERRAAGQPAAR